MPVSSPARPLHTPQRRELYFFALYRVLEAALFVLLAYVPLAPLSAEMQQPVLAKMVSVVYLAISAVLLWSARNAGVRVRRQAAIGLCCDLVAATSALLTQNGLDSGVSLLLLFNIGAGGLILTARSSLGFALLASGVVLSEYVINRLFGAGGTAPVAEAVMFSVTYLAAAVLFNLLAKQVEQSHALAEKRGEELANLSEINELVIRRMRTGVLVVDGSHRIRLWNEAAWGLLGNPSASRRDLADVAPALHQSLWHWRQGRGEVPKALTLAEGLPEVLPRFVAISLADTMVLLFLDDSRIYSDRAEELTLSTLGRLSASIAHEIRNPLAAISYSAQLLDESEQLPETDRRLLEIIHSQISRMNGIVQNILGLARQERSQTESVELVAFSRTFVQEYRENHPLETDVLQAVDSGHRAVAMVDPQHLHQVLTILVHNALTYGRRPGEPAQVTVAVRRDAATGAPILEVIDRGPGVALRVVEQIFTAFFTTSDHGTGLGLYIARQLCEANQSVLSFESVPAGGSCFRIVLPAAHSVWEGLQPG
jgi:two-component system sensor histidine kinase PilS (NtrC family)